MEHFRAHFPLLEQHTYLNTAASGVLSNEVMDFRRSHDRDLFRKASMLREKQDVILSETREAVGRIFNCAPDWVALVPNFSYGFNSLLEGIPGSKKVLLLENDYPSINWAVQARDFLTCYAKIDEFLEENIKKAIQKHQPDVFAFSLVQYINGIKIDFDFLKQLKQENPNLLLIADGTQYCGTETFDFEASGIDILGASAYKWLNAGYGNAFFLFRETVTREVSPKAFGFNSMHGKYRNEKENFIGKLEPGHQDTLNFGSLLAAIRLVEDIGQPEIENHIKTLSAEAKTVFEDLNLLEECVVNRKTHSSIFNIEGEEALFQYLLDKNIVCSQRGEGIRISFHAFNTLEEVQFLRAVLHAC